MKTIRLLPQVRLVPACLAAAGFLLVLAGCSEVYTPYPLTRDLAAAAKPPPLPVGIWVSGPPYNLEARIGPDGHAWVGSLVWENENKRYRLIATEAWVTPRKDDAVPTRGFVSLRQQDGEGHPIERFGLLEYGRADKTLLIWKAQRVAFRDAIEHGELEGEIFDNGENVLVTSPKEKLLEYLERPDHMMSERFDARPSRSLFFYTKPVVLHLAYEDPEADTGARALESGGSATLKNPSALTLVTSVTEVSAGLLTPAEGTAQVPMGPDGIPPKLTALPTLQRSTTRIPAILGTSFGACFVVDGSPANSKVELTAVWHFPDPGLAEDSRTHPWYREEYAGCFHIGKRGFQSYTFRYNWMLVPGVWTMELWQGERRLLTQQFEVYLPAASGTKSASDRAKSPGTSDGDP